MRKLPPKICECGNIFQPRNRKHSFCGAFKDKNSCSYKNYARTKYISTPAVKKAKMYHDYLFEDVLKRTGSKARAEAEVRRVQYARNWARPGGLSFETKY